MLRRPWMPLLAVCVLGVVAPGARASRTAVQEQSVRLFSIELSSTQNQLRYDVALKPDCRPTSEPIHAYWQLLSEGPDVTRELKFRERFRHFGLTGERVQDGRFQFALNGRPERTIRVHTRRVDGECSAEPWTTLTDGRIHARIERIFVKAEPTEWWQPAKVDYVEVRGVDEEGHEVLERLRP